MTWLRLPAADWRLIVAGGLLSALAYPPFHLLVPSFLALVPAVWLVAEATEGPHAASRLLKQGFWYGFLAYGAILYWMVGALWHFTRLALLGYLATIGILGLYTGLVFFLTGWVVRRTRVAVVWAFPVFWTAFDWWIGHQGDIRFPWLGLGTSLTGFPTLIQIADLIGARGITFLLVLANAALALAWRVRRERGRAVALAASVGGGLLVALLYGLYRERTLPMHEVGAVTVLQPNAAPGEKWDPRSRGQIFGDLLVQSARALDAPSDLMVWPEAAVPGPFEFYPQWRNSIARHAAEHATPLVVGALEWVRRADGRGEFFNAAFFFDATGRDRAYPVYRKRYLVPVTERVPFLPPEWFGKLEFFGGFAKGRDQPLYRIGAGSFGVLICYESIFENLSRSYRRQGADLLVNITNDAWFGRSSAPYQHAAHLVMRAIENRVGIARAANTGISGFVDPLGRQHQRTPLFVSAAETRRLETSEVIPPYTRFGDWMGWGSVAVALLLLGAAWLSSPLPSRTRALP